MKYFVSLIILIGLSACSAKEDKDKFTFIEGIHWTDKSGEIQQEFDRIEEQENAEPTLDLRDLQPESYSVRRYAEERQAIYELLKCISQDLDLKELYKSRELQEVASQNIQRVVLRGMSLDSTMVDSVLKRRSIIRRLLDRLGFDESLSNDGSSLIKKLESETVVMFDAKDPQPLVCETFDWSLGV